MSVLAVDVGGTFTDVVTWDGSRLGTAKVASTADQSEGVVDGATAGGSGYESFLHGTTVATNALLEHKGAATALVTDAGFEDVLEIGRQDRPSLYDSAADRPVPLVPRDARFGIRREPVVGDLSELADAVARTDPDAVAVSLLYAFEDPDRERLVADALRRRLPGVPVSRSAVVVAEFREYERTATTVVNAYLTPVAGRYLDRLRDRAVAAGLPGDIAVMRSSGGLIGSRRAAELPAAILLSGPAAGVVAAADLGSVLGNDTVISFDMGGTSTDVCRIEGGRPEVTYERPVGGYPCQMPSVAVHTIGAGGGSIGWIDEGGALRVGPESAGAIPGPASYGRGGDRAAVTDANVHLGRIPAGSTFGEGLEIEPERAAIVLEALGAPVGLDAEAAARGLISIVEEHMAAALRRVSIEEGADPRSAVLVAFGGAGGLHVGSLARKLDMAGAAVPANAGVFSALGLLLSPPRADAARTVMLAEDDLERLDPLLAEVVEAAMAELAGAGAAGTPSSETFVDVRYVGQSHELSVPYRPGDGPDLVARRFHDIHRSRNGFARDGDPIEVVTVRAEATTDPAVRWADLPEPVPDGEMAARGETDVLGASGPLRAGVWWRPSLAPGDTVEGPAIIAEPEATTFLHPAERATVHPSGALVVEW